MPPKKVVSSKPTTKPGSKASGVKPAGGGGKNPTGGKGVSKGAAAAPAPPPPVTYTCVGLKAVPGVVENSQSATGSNKWTLVVDKQGSVGTFFKYRNACYIQADLPGEMTPDKLRMALLGALRFGKPLVIDCGEADISCVSLLDEVQDGLCDALLSRSLLQNEAYTSLVRPGDERDYQGHSVFLIDAFAFVVVTQHDEPNPSLAHKFDCYKVE